ncbi:MAG: protein kinase, partial [Anaerolineae bacterium]|nr:protein kinase [Anaerolineae bacterium]
IAAALDYAHAAGVIHRDLKPPNILIDEQGNPYLTDFGVARLLQSTQRLTQTGAAVGTPAYMAPEQWRGESVGPHTDLYALGVVLYEMVTGDQPFKADTTYGYMYKHVYEEPDPPRRLMEALPDEVEAVLLKSLAKEPASRYANARTMSDALSQALTHGHLMPTRPVGLGEDQTLVETPEDDVTAVVPTPPDAIPALRIVDTHGASSTPAGGTRQAAPAAATLNHAPLGTPAEPIPPVAAAAGGSSRRGLWVIGGVAAAAVIVIGLLLLSNGRSGDGTPTAGASPDGTSGGVVVGDVPTTAAPTLIDTPATELPSLTPSDVPTVTVTFTATPSVTPTWTPSATDTPDGGATDMAEQVATSQQVVRNLTATANAAIIGLATGQAAQTGTAIAVASFTATPSSTPTDTLTPTETPSITPSRTPTATPTRTPTATWTRLPTSTPLPPMTATYTLVPTIAPTATATPVSCDGLLPSRIQVGGIGIVSDEDPRPLNVRAGPGTNQARIGQLEVGTQFVVLDGPVCSATYPWFQVRGLDATALTGWIAESGEGVYYVDSVAGALSQAACEGVLPTRLALGGRAIVDTPTGQPLRLHDTPGTDEPITGLIPDGMRVTIQAGMVCLDDYSWWQYETDDGRTGWSSEADDDSYFLAPLE